MIVAMQLFRSIFQPRNANINMDQAQFHKFEL